MTEEKTLEENKVEEEENASKLPSPKSVLAKFEGAPDRKTLDDWKAKFGTIFVTAFDVDEIFVCRCLDRKTWTDLNRRAMENQQKIIEHQTKMLQDGKTEIQAIKATQHLELDQEEMTVSAALLWKSISDEELYRKGGIITALSDAIMTRSRFIPAQIVGSLTEEL